MAEIVPEASDRVAPRPEATAPGNRARLGPRGKLRVFISYSRDDEVFPDQLKAALETCEFECVIDRQDIPAGEDWRKRLGDLIVEADAVVFVLSRASARSPTCIWEVDESVRLGKRILPVIGKSLGGASLPPRLQDLQHIFFYQEPAEPTSGWGNGLKRLVEALSTDIEWSASIPVTSSAPPNGTCTEGRRPTDYCMATT